MEQQFLPYDEAYALKELGFDELCLAFFKSDKRLLLATPSMANNGTLPFYYKNSEASNWLSNLFSSKENKRKTISTPLFQQAFNWFRTNYNLNGKVVYYNNVQKWGVCVYNLDMTAKEYVEFLRKEDRTIKFNSHEEAELAAIRKLIGLIKS